MTKLVIGDIHGCYKQLVELMEKALAQVPDPEEIIFLGDYVDRGPDTKSVIEYLIGLDRSGHNCVFLKGNHEDMLVNDFQMCMYNGGSETMKSYGWDGETALYELGYDPLTLIPQEHWLFFKSLKLYHEDSKRVYVHAGIDRGRRMDDQIESVLLWVRQPFLHDPRDDGRYVVHGHTPMENGVLPQEKPNRVNLDTGLVFGGRLTCAIFDDTQSAPVGYIQVGKDTK